MIAPIRRVGRSTVILSGALNRKGDHMTRISRPLLILVSALLLVACGGGDAGGQPTAAPTPQPTTAALATTDGSGSPFAGMSRDEFEQAVKNSLTNADFEAAAQLMTD